MSEFRDDEIEIAIFRNASTKVHMQLTHLKTGVKVQSEGESEIKLKRRLLAQLRNKMDVLGHRRE